VLSRSLSLLRSLDLGTLLDGFESRPLWLSIDAIGDYALVFGKKIESMRRGEVRSGEAQRRRAGRGVLYDFALSPASPVHEPTTDLMKPFLVK